jgi:signal transduction histidine kinase
MLTVLRRAAGLVGAALIITTLCERPSILPRELQVLIAAGSGIAFALVFDSASGALLDRSLAKASLEAARTLQRFTTDLAALPAAELHANVAHRLAETLATREIAVYWRSTANQPLRLVSAHQTPEDCPDTLREDSPLLRQSERERASWWLARGLPSVDTALAGFALCVPVLEREQVLLMLLTGHKRGPLGFTQQEISALQAWALACHHTLTTRALIERETAQQQLVYAGKLAAGIAHNLRNPLAIVRAYLEADPGIGRPHLDELHEFALKESARIQSTIDGLTALSRGERFMLAPHDLGALVTRAVELNHSYIAECRATVEIIGTPTEREILAEPWQLTTALTNLLRNSAEEVARDGGGWIRIELVAGPPGSVELRVRDSGRGLPAHIRDAVFSRDLFAQTTKSTASPSRRTGFGIGLHSTMLIVTIGHGGQFDYRDGAFVLTLPLAAAPSAPRRE